MGSQKKMKILCLHGFRTSGSFLKNQITTKWPSIASQFDMDFPDGIFPAAGKSDIEGIYPPPYYEWFQFDKGATLSGLLLGYQAQGKVLKDHPPFKFCISISGAMFRDPSICDIAYKDPIKAKSVHFIGAKDWLRRPSEDFATAFDNPLIIRHPYGHTVPRLDDAATEQLCGWTKTISECNNTENGDAKEKHNRTDSVITESKIQNKKTSTAVDIKTTERQVEAVEATYA